MPSILKEISSAKLYVVGEYDEYEMQHKETIEKLIKKHKIEKRF